MDKIKDSFKKLSSREKTLIYILVILLIVCFGWLILLQPQLTSHTSLKSSKDSLELQLTELKGTSSSSSTEDIKTQIMNVNQEIKALNDQFYNLMSKERVMNISAWDADDGSEGTVSVTTEKIGDNTYAFAVIRTPGRDPDAGEDGGSIHL